MLKTVHVALIDNSGDRGIAERVIDVGRSALRRQGRARDVPARSRQHRLRRRAQPRAARHRRRLSPRAQSRRRARRRCARQRRPLARCASGSRRARTGGRRRRPATASTCASAIRRCSTSRCAASRRASLRRLFERRLARYEMRDIVDVDPPRDAIGVPVMSGAFVLARRDAIDRTGGFDPAVLPLLRGLRLERAARTQWRATHTCRASTSSITAEARRARACATSLWFVAQRVQVLREARLAVDLVTACRTERHDRSCVTGAAGFIGRAFCDRASAQPRCAFARSRRTQPGRSDGVAIDLAHASAGDARATRSPVSRPSFTSRDART